jgi:hypothetical protein
MAQASVRQNKLRKLVFVPETTLGTAETLDDTSLVIPAENVTVSPSRGTRIIPRNALLDGFHGEVTGTAGSWGWTYSYDCEVHDCDNTVNTLSGYWPQLLGAAGFKAVDDGTNLVITPTQNNIGNFSAAATTNPFGLTMGFFLNDNDNSDYAHVMRGCTQNVTINASAGERLIMNFAGVGLVTGNQLIDTTVTTDDVGDYSQIGGAPFVVQNMTCTFTDNDDASSMTVVALNDVSITAGSETPDVTEPCGSGNYGFAVSPVFWNRGGTVSFTIADTDATDAKVYQKFFSGTTFSITLQLSAASGNTIEIEMPKVQFEDVTSGEANGYATYSITGRMTRPIGDSSDGSFLKIDYAYA